MIGELDVQWEEYKRERLIQILNVAISHIDKGDWKKFSELGGKYTATKRENAESSLLFYDMKKYLRGEM